jgi:hypothetical protein
VNYVSVKPIGSQKDHHHVRAYVAGDNGDYLLEVANSCYADAQLLAIAALSPEIVEYLKVLDTPLSRLLISQIGRLTQEFSESARGS